MNLKKNFQLFLILGITLWGIFSCSDNDEEIIPPPPTYAQLSDVDLKQTINGQELFELTKNDAELTFSSQLTFNEKEANWSKPTLEQSFHKFFDLSKDDVTVTTINGTKISSVDISIDENNGLKVVFGKVDNSYSYLQSSTITISLVTKLKPDISYEEVREFNNVGYVGQSIFYDELPATNIKSSLATVISKLNPDVTYNVKGDPNNHLYPYKLNIVYFVPSDIQANADYKRRISTILLKHQLFVRKWMKHWGYEEKSFGLPLDENGMVEIITVNAKGPKANYPYSGGNSIMKREIDEYYAENNLQRYSEHTLVISAINESTDDTPFYGTGKWCYALDYPEMTYESMAIDPVTGETLSPKTDASHKATVWIGGMLHELGHALNEPHVGPCYSQKNDPKYGITLMGSGNRTYGETPTFMHHASAATMNNCQISSYTNKTFYGAATASVKITGVTINGGECTVKGIFTAPVNVTDVIVRFYNSTESFLGGSHGYTSVAFVVKPAENTFEATIPIEELRVNSFDYRIGVSILMENGLSQSTSQPYVYKLVNGGSSGYTLGSEDIINDGTWEVTTSHPLPEDIAISNAPGSLIDGDVTTCLSMVKPGKNYEGVRVGADEKVFAIIDFKKQMEFNTIMLINRNFQVYLNTKAVSFYGSNDGSTYTAIIADAKLPENKENTVLLNTTVKYRFLKMTFDEWDSSAGSTMQFAELMIFNK